MTGQNLGQIGTLAGQLTSLKSEVVQLGAQMQHQNHRMSEVERQLRDITAGKSLGSGTASSAGSSETHPEPARASGAYHPPKHQRTVLVVGGFSDDTERDVTCKRLREIFGQKPGVKDWWIPGKVGSVGKVNYHTTFDACKFLKKYKGTNFTHGTKQLCHTWDRAKEEVLLSKRVSLAIKVLRTRAVEKGILAQGAELGIDGDWERGRVWFKNSEQRSAP